MSDEELFDALWPPSGTPEGEPRSQFGSFALADGSIRIYVPAGPRIAAVSFAASGHPG